jgi:hypothetical protein
MVVDKKENICIIELIMENIYLRKILKVFIYLDIILLVFSVILLIRIPFGSIILQFTFIYETLNLIKISMLINYNIRYAINRIIESKIVKIWFIISIISFIISIVLYTFIFSFALPNNV